MSPQTQLERLAFVNGQRLTAAELRVEQGYHLGMRWRLNRALFDPGIAEGLEVTVKPGDGHTVVVWPGVALDEQGRELVVLAPREVAVAGVPSQVEGVVYGNYLVIEYAEEPVGVAGGECGTAAATRVRSVPRLRWQQAWPRAGSGQVVLAQVELAGDCTVRHLYYGVRDPHRSSRTMAYALEGEKDIDGVNPQDLYFHIRGQRPERVVLYLRAAAFSTLYYTEMGGHTHGRPVDIPVTVVDHTAGALHRHSVPPGNTGPARPEPRHGHQLRIEEGVDAVGANEWRTEVGWNANLIKLGGEHTHGFVNVETVDVAQSLTHAHAATARPAEVGAADTKAVTRTTRLTYVDGLRVRLESQGLWLTDRILRYLVGRDGPGSWPSSQPAVASALGDGTGGHDLATRGTGELDLIALGLDPVPGEHHIRLSVPSGGGKVSYNLYVE